MEQVMKTAKHLFSLPYCVCLLHVQDRTFSPNSFRNVNLILATDRYYPLLISSPEKKFCYKQFI